MRLNSEHAKSHNKTVYSFWPVLFLGYMLVNGCSTVDLTEDALRTPVDQHYRHMFVNVVLSDPAESKWVSDKLVSDFSQHDLETTNLQKSLTNQSAAKQPSATLKLEEIDRRTQSIVQYRQYGRTALTRTRGREVHEKPVITLRATVIDTNTGMKIFQADYITQGPWYTDSARVIASVSKPLVVELEQVGLIKPQ